MASEPQTAPAFILGSGSNDCGHQAGILCLETHIACTAEDIRLAAQAFSFPCVVKPFRSFRTAFPSGRKNYVATSARDLLRFYEQYPDLVGTTLWQEVIDGPD